ncbi:MAG TPA: hypothetical protein VFP97_11800 [Chitinophagaceae bacterium]|nr:hypothetical protein [Chitinophagaceae bacterium]
MRVTTVVLSIFTLIACSSDDKNIDDVPIAISDTILVWNVNADSMVMKKDTLIPDTAITIQRIINGLNEKYPEVQLVFLKQSTDTLYTEVPNGEYLGNQMGSAGASAWFADATINLTSVPGINYVSFTMDTFSHAGSTTIGRDEYKAWKRR